MRELYIYKGYAVEYNQIPDAQFDFGGFGWAFRVIETGTPPNSQTNKELFRAILKAQVYYDDAVKEIARQQLKSFVEALIDNGTWERKQYCFSWQIGATNMSEGDCDQIASP